MKNKICALVFCSAMLGLGTAEAAYVTVSDATGNDTMATALNLNTNFDQSVNADIGDLNGNNISTTFFHASARAVTGTEGYDWYSFNVNQANAQAYFDMDYAMPDLDSYINLYDSIGNLVAFSDDGEITDSGSIHFFDSFLSVVLTNPGLYYLSVGQYPDIALTSGQDYTLHVSFNSQPSNVPVPAAVWLFGSGIIGLMGVRRKKTFTAPVTA